MPGPAPKRSPPVINRFERRAYAFLDKDKHSHQKILNSLDADDIPYTLVPVGGGMPTVSFGASDYRGIVEIRLFIHRYLQNEL